MSDEYSFGECSNCGLKGALKDGKCSQCQDVVVDFINKLFGKKGDKDGLCS